MKILISLSFMLISFGLLSQCPDQLHFSSQSELDSFPIKFPNCDSVSSGILLFNEISDPSPLDQIRYIKDYLIIQNTQIELLDHFPNLKHVGNFIDIVDNASLKSVKGFDAFDGLQLKTHLSFQNNDSLKTIDLDISGEALFNLVALNNASLQAISAPDLIRIGGLDFAINHKMTDLEFPILKTINNNLTLYKLEKLSEFGNFNDLNYIGGKVQIQENAALTSIDLSDVQGIKTGLTIEWNPVLEEILFPESGLDTILLFKIIGNSSLKTLNGPSLDYIQLFLEISQNDALEKISGFDGLDRIKLSTKLQNNLSLTDISGLSDILALGNELQITGNTNLSLCTIPSVCNHLSAGKFAEIDENDNGCSTIEDVIAACTSSIDEKDFNNIQVFPNPANHVIHIKLEKDNSCQIYDLNGLLMKSVLTKNLKAEIDVSDLDNGLYILQIGSHSIKMQVIR